MAAKAAAFFTRGGGGGAASAALVLAAALVVVVLSSSAGVARADFAQDRAMCVDKLMGLATCLTFVQEKATARAPTPGCCAGLKQVLASSKKCMCVLVKDRDEPGLGFKINVTRAMDLPSLCNSPATLLRLPQRIFSTRGATIRLRRVCRLQSLSDDLFKDAYSDLNIVVEILGMSPDAPEAEIFKDARKHEGQNATTAAAATGLRPCSVP